LFAGGGHLGRVIGLRGGQQLGRGKDVRPEELRQSIPRGSSVERLDGIADVGLIAEQTLRGDIWLKLRGHGAVDPVS
jgi:hypothetical protein